MVLGRRRVRSLPQQRWLLVPPQLWLWRVSGGRHVLQLCHLCAQAIGLRAHFGVIGALQPCSVQCGLSSGGGLRRRLAACMDKRGVRCTLWYHTV